MKTDAKKFNKGCKGRFPLQKQDRIQEVIFDGSYIDYLNNKAQQSTISAAPTSG